MLTKTLSEAKKKRRNILIKAMNNDIGSIDSAKDSWNPAQISERAKDISYIRSLVDSWNPAQLNEALKMLDLPVIDTWNPAQIEEQRRNLVFYLAERTLTGNPITLKILGNLTPEVTGLKVTMNPIQDLHGYEYPWVGGAGINKLNLADMSGSENNYYLQFATGFALTAGQTYTFSADITSSVEPFNFSIGVGDTSYALDIAGNNNLTNGRKIMTFTPTEAQLSGRPNMFLRVPRYGQVTNFTYSVKNIQLELGSTAHDFEPYENICPISGRTEASVTRTSGEDVETKTHEYNETIWWGEDDFKNGGMEVIGAEIASYDGETLSGEWMSDRDVYAPDTTPTTGAQVVYKNTPTTIETTPEEITLLKGTNVLSTDGDSIELKYKQNF